MHATGNTIPCLIFEDEHLLVVNKPAGLNTHSPSPFAGEGIYDWLRNLEARWAKLAIIHRLDKETSGVIIFGKTGLANRSLTEQFTSRAVRKKYLLLTDRPVPERAFTVKSSLVRAGEKYVSRPLHAGSELAETRFRRSVAADVRRLQFRPGSAGIPAGWFVQNEFAGRDAGAPRDAQPPHVGCYEVMAEPVTGRTHQIRVHAADKGFPIIGDTLYGGTAAARVCLHAVEITVLHPASGEQMTFAAPVDFSEDRKLALRKALISPETTNGYRLIHGASDGWPGWYVDRLGDFLLSQGESDLAEPRVEALACMLKALSARGAYHKILMRRAGKGSPAEMSPQHVLGEAAPERFIIRENGLQFELSFHEGYSVGLFLDQRDNRRRLMTGEVARDFSLCEAGDSSRSDFAVLNTFAYTCAFSVSAAKAGARTVSIDLSKKYLEWGKRNFSLNDIDPAQHEFIYGDAFDWLRRLGKKQPRFDMILLDPPTFSQSKESGVFQAEKDYGKLVSLALILLKAGGVLFASTNAAGWPPEKFLMTVENAIHAAKRKVLQQQYFPQPPDFPVSRAEPAYLKTVWLRIA